MANPVVPDPTGENLIPYVGLPVTAGNEIDKLAYNVSISRDTASVQLRTDG